MKNITTLKDLLIEQLQELYNAEKQQFNALATLKERATFRELRLAIQNHISETHDHIKRLENIFEKLEITSFGEQSDAMSGLIKEGFNLTSRGSDPEVLDAGIIAAIQHMEHFEIAGYGTVCAFARELSLNDIADQLHQTLTEEKRIDKKLSEISYKINERAISPVIY